VRRIRQLAGLLKTRFVERLLGAFVGPAGEPFEVRQYLGNGVASLGIRQAAALMSQLRKSSRLVSQPHNAF
jgi:hypothetical protein